jgi:hypothetical protein
MTISRLRPTRRTLTRHVAATAVLVAAAAAVVIAPGVANASACTTTSGQTSNLALSAPSGVHPTGGTIFVKQPPGCLDLNLTKATMAEY